MLYVFQMDVGQMLTFEISLLMDTVATLQQELARVTGISVDKQILLVSGGHSLKPQQKVISYGAGTDTNPVFLFSKLAIESQEPPLVKSFGLSKEVISALKDRITEAINLPVGFDTVAKRTKIACEIRDSANRVLAFCTNEFKEQHLQYQGWGTVVANLEEIAQAMQKTETKFKKAFTTFLPLREKYFKMLENFQETISLLGRIPLLKSLKDKEIYEVLSKRSQEEGIISFVASSSSGPSTLLEWITTQGQGQSIDAIQVKCYDDLILFDSDMFAQLDRDVQEQLSLVMQDPHQMKELVGIERRLSELEKRLNEAKKITQEQSDMAQGFLNQQSRLSSTQSPALILPDLCLSHQQQLKQMLERQQRIEILQNNFKKSKQEMSTNIHQRLGWVMHIETRISKLDSDLIYYMKTLRVLECNLELLSQIRAAPQVYADMVVEAARRRLFSSKFLQWAEALVDDSKQLYLSETERRKQFARKLGEHFLLDTLFKGFDDMPPSFATKSPPSFDTLLPDITMDDIALLKNAVPELEKFFCVSMDAGSLSLSLLSKVLYESPRFQMVIPQSSQTEWLDQSESMSKPSIIVATEAPPTKFTLPEVTEILGTDYPPTSPSPAETNKTVPTSSTKPASNQSSARGSEVTSESSSSAVALETVPGVQSVRTQTKTNSTHTDSTSLISSNEFATADFYFEDSMPSPVAFSPLEKKEVGKVEADKRELDTVASLQAELAEKVSYIRALELRLKDKDIQLSDTEKLSSQKCSSTDESSTLVGTTDILETTETSDSGDAISNKSGLTDVGVGGAQDKNQRGSPTADHSKDITESSASSLLTDERVRNLELELASANSHVAKLKESSVRAETRLQELQEQTEKTLLDKESVILKLESQLQLVKNEFSDITKISECKDETINNLKTLLSQVKAMCEKLEQDVKSKDENVVSIKEKLLQLKDKWRIDLPSLKQDLSDLREDLLGYRTELDLLAGSTVSAIETQVSQVRMAILDDAQQGYKRERDSLVAETQQLKVELSKLLADFSEKVIHLQSMNEELLSQADKKEKEFAARYEEQRKDFDSSLKDLETKYALEMEIELDRVRAELRESSEEVDRLSSLNTDLNKELFDVKRFTEKQREDLERVHMGEMEELKCSNARDIEAATAFLDEKLKSDFSHERRIQAAETEAKIESVQASLTSEKEKAILALTEQIKEQHEAELAELKQQLKEHDSNFVRVLEDKQLEHVHKLTQLKIDFDMERDSLVAEIKKLGDVEKVSKELQTDYHLLVDGLTNTDTQTEVVNVPEVLTHSETQTGMELLAEVISLTSSASYGSEEMIAHKQLSTLTEDKDTRDTETINQLLQTVDDLNVQLAKAQEKISSMEGELTALYAGRSEAQQEIMTDSASAQKDLMQTSCVTTSFMVMDKEQCSQEVVADTEAVRAKDKIIANLEKKLMKLSMTASERETAADKVSIRGCDKGDVVLLCLDERHDHYVVFTVGTNLHFLHSESHETLGLKTSGEASYRKPWILAEVVEKEYCLAKKPNNRFRVPQGTCFYRVKCKPWKCEAEPARQERDTGGKLVKPHGRVPSKKKS